MSADGSAVTGGATPGAMLRRAASTVSELRRRDPLLFGVAAINAVLFGAFAAGVGVDPSMVNGEPAFLKPAKFAGSIALACATLGWLTVHLPLEAAYRRRTSLIIGSGFLVEIALIGGQAARGVGSHFNRSTALDGAIAAVMGVTIVVVTGSIAVLASRARRGEFDVHPAFATGVLLGLGLFVAGAVEGGTMIALQSRTVDAAGPTVPLVGWHALGDFRVAHFVGLHALQAVPLAGYVSASAHRRGLIDRPRRAVVLVAGGYGVVLVGTLLLGVAPLVL